MKGTVRVICICPAAGEPMQPVLEVEAIAGVGLKGDRYATAEGSFSKGQVGKRQVTLINALFFLGSGFEFTDSRRNIITDGVQLMDLISQEFRIGRVLFRGIKYCDPCNRPTKLSGKPRSFHEAFFDRGGLVAEIIEGGMIRVGDTITPPDKGYDPTE